MVPTLPKINKNGFFIDDIPDLKHIIYFYKCYTLAMRLSFSQKNEHPFIQSDGDDI